MDEKKIQLVSLIDRLEDVKESYKILKENYQNIKTKRRVFKYLKGKRDRLLKQDEKYFKKCKEITGESEKEDCLRVIKRMCNEEET